MSDSTTNRPHAGGDDQTNEGARAPETPPAPAPQVPAAAAPERTVPDGPVRGRGAGDQTVTGPGSAEAPPKPKIGDSRPAPTRAATPAAGGTGTGTGTGSTGTGSGGGTGTGSGRRRRRRRGGRGGGGGQSGQGSGQGAGSQQQGGGRAGGGSGRSGAPQQRSGGSAKRRGERSTGPTPVDGSDIGNAAVELDDETLERRRGRQRKGRAVGRFQMYVHVAGEVTHTSIFEGRSMIEHYASRPSDDVFEIHGNIYVGKVENVLPGMEAAFVDIGTPKSAVLYRSDVQFDPEEVETQAETPRIEELLRARQLITCQVTKNPIAHKGARLTQEVSLAGRFVVLVPNSTTYGISKRLPDNERKRLRKILDRVRPEGHGIIVRTAAEGATAEEIERDVSRLADQWTRIAELAAAQTRPGLIYREPAFAMRMIREEFSAEYRSVVIDDRAVYEELRDYVAAVAPELADRVEYYDPAAEQLSLFDRYHVTEQLVKALDRTVWLPSGGSLVIERTEALTVIDVNTGRNVGSSSLEETVLHNNLEAAEEIARQLRLRDIGGIIVIDFVDMDVKENRDRVVKAFREALSRDKTRTQVFNISDLGLVEMTRKRIGEGLLESVAEKCDSCAGRGLIVPEELLG